MSLYKSTDLGTVKISNVLFAQMIVNSFRQKECAGKIWPATTKGKQIGNDQKYNISDVASHIILKHSSDCEDLELEFNVIIMFGNIISKITTCVADYISDCIEKNFGKKPNRIIIHITGIRSKQIARRNLEVIKQYEY